MKDDSIFLHHILDAITTIEEHVGTTPHIQFVHNKMMQDAVVRELEIIGEAARNLSDALRAQYQEIEWDSIISMRNRLIHAYFRVDIELVWDIIKNDIPALKGQIEGILY